MSTLVDFAGAKDAVSFKSAFEQSLAAKVSDALEAKKYEVVQKYFNGATVEESAEHLEEALSIGRLAADHYHHSAMAADPHGHPFKYDISSEDHDGMAKRALQRIADQHGHAMAHAVDTHNGHEMDAVSGLMGAKKLKAHREAFKKLIGHEEFAKYHNAIDRHGHELAEEIEQVDVDEEGGSLLPKTKEG
jgi:tRNA U38,U39,U40 pseudouridine synthase TruA